MKWGGVRPVSLVDYPGHVCTTLFTAGCNMRCPYCYNPSLVLGQGEGVSSDAVMELLRARRDRVKHLCITGGEPTMHPELPGFVAEAVALGYRVKLDTNGTNPSVVEGLLARGLLSYVAMDVKTTWGRYHRLGIADTRPLRETVSIIRRLAPDYEFRTTVVPGLVGWEELLAMAAELQGARRFVLQQFRPGPELLDPSWKTIRPYPAEWLVAWAQQLAPFFQEPVVVRNAGRAAAGTGSAGGPP